MPATVTPTPGQAAHRRSPLRHSLRARASATTAGTLLSAQLDVTYVPTHERRITWDICREPRHPPLRCVRRSFAPSGLGVRSYLLPGLQLSPPRRLGRFGLTSRLPGPTIWHRPGLRFRPFGREASPPIGLSGAPAFRTDQGSSFSRTERRYTPQLGDGVKFCERSQANLGNGRKSSPCGRDLGRFVQFQRRGRRGFGYAHACHRRQRWTGYSSSATLCNHARPKDGRRGLQVAQFFGGSFRSA